MGRVFSLIVASWLAPALAFLLLSVPGSFQAFGILETLNTSAFIGVVGSPLTMLVAWPATYFAERFRALGAPIAVFPAAGAICAGVYVLLSVVLTGGVTSRGDAGSYISLSMLGATWGSFVAGSALPMLAVLAAGGVAGGAYGMLRAVRPPWTRSLRDILPPSRSPTDR